MRVDKGGVKVLVSNHPEDYFSEEEKEEEEDFSSVEEGMVFIFNESRMGEESVGSFA